MTISETLVPEFDEEMATTRRLLERVPSDKGPWKPHPKSFALGHLAQLVATMPGWVTRMVGTSEINLAGGAGYSLESTESLLEQFDKVVGEARTAITKASDADYDVAWSLKMGDQVLFTTTRGKAVRQTINHLVHHRGQLTVYLRLLDVPVPSIYGPTADEPWGGGKGG
ncbi:MAG: DinB family protein [Gemmatimonadaceae bacterium]